MYGRNPNQLKGLLHMVLTFADDIQMSFGLDKCVVAHFVNGKLSKHNAGVTVGKRTPSTVWNRVKSPSIWVWTRVTVSRTPLCGRHSVVNTFAE